MKLSSASILTCLLAAGLGAARACPPAVPPEKKAPAPVWISLEAALLRAGMEAKPVALLFAPRDYRGPAAFGSAELRAALRDSDALTARLSPPRRPVLPEKPTAAKCDRLIRRYQHELAVYRAVADRYDAGSGKAWLVLLSPDGRVAERLAAPARDKTLAALAELPARIVEMSESETSEGKKLAGRGAAKDLGPFGNSGADGLPVVDRLNTGTVFDVRPVASGDRRYIHLEVRASFTRLRIMIEPLEVE